MAVRAVAEDNRGMKTRLYLEPLDGLRFLAFLAVLLNHLPSTGVPWMQVVNYHGWIGVDLFFVISAFLFFTLFEREYQVTGRLAVGNFFLRRLLRIYPLMVCAPALFMAIGPVTDVAAAWRQLEALALFRDNLLWLPSFSRGIPYAEHLWTLSFEFQVYLALPFLFMACARLGRNRGLLLLGVLWLLGLALRARYSMQPHPFIYFSPWLRPDSIIVGLALAMLAPMVRGGAAIAAVTLVGALTVFVSLPNVYDPGLSVVPLFAAAAFACGALLWLALRWQPLTRVLSARPMVFLGQRSFGLYVFHIPAMYLLRPAATMAAYPVTHYFTWVASTLLASIAAATLSYRYLERPFLLLKDARAVILTRPVA